MPSPEHNAVAQRLLESMGAMEALPLDQKRKVYDERMGAAPVPKGITLTEDTIEHIPALWIAPDNPKGTMLYLHGGGYSTGSIVAFRALCAAIALSTQNRVCLIDYRLAPEHPYPAAKDDALLAYRWLLDKHKIPPSSLTIAGDSAGGGLALVTLLNAKQAQLPLPSCASVFSPWTDLSNSGDSMTSGAIDDPILTKGPADALAQMYCPSHDLTDPLVSPLFGDLAGLPPIQIHVGTRETLLDDSRRFAAKARDASVEVDYFEGEELIHVWPLVAADAPETADALSRVGAFIAKHIS